MNGHLYLIGYKAGASGNTHKLSLEGDLISTFGSLYKSLNTFVESRLTMRGQIACIERSGVVGAIKEQVPALTGYSEDGTILWTVRIGGINAAPVEERGETFSKSSPEVGEGWLYSLFSDATGNFNVVYMVISGEQQPTPSHVFRINAEDGIGTYAGHSRALNGITFRLRNSKQAFSTSKCPSYKDRQLVIWAKSPRNYWHQDAESLLRSSDTDGDLDLVQSGAILRLKTLSIDYGLESCVGLVSDVGCSHRISEHFTWNRKNSIGRQIKAKMPFIYLVSPLYLLKARIFTQ